MEETKARNSASDDALEPRVEETPTDDATAEEQTPPAAEEADELVQPEPEEAESLATESTPVTSLLGAEEISEPAEEVTETVMEKPTEEKPAASPAPAPRRGGFVPLVLGGVIAAALGAGATIYALPNLPPQLAALLPLPQASVPDTEAKLTDQAAKIDALTKDLAALKSATPPAPDLSGVQTALDEASAASRALGDRINALEGRITALENRPVGGGDLGGDAAALQGQIDALKGELAKVGPTVASQEEIAAAAAEAKAKIDAAEAQAADLRAQSEAAARRAMAQAAVARIGAAFDAGAPLAPALADAEAAGLALPEVLKGDVVGLATLQANFPDAARAALAAARKATAGDKLTDRIGAFLMAQTGARSIEPREGSDPDAVLSRAQAAVDAGDLSKAVTEIGTLPEAGQALLADWVAQAKARLTAAQAVVDLAQSVK